MPFSPHRFQSVTSTSASVRYRFGPFELQPEERRLLADGVAVRIGPHAFDLLIVLVERCGHLVTKDELLVRVWHHVVVEENTLQVHVAALRKVLGTDAIATVSGRGYRFTHEVTCIRGESTPRQNLPHQLTTFIGREKEIAEVGRLLASTRLLTLTGAGGCGKTRLALRVAGDVLTAYQDGVWLVECAVVRDATHIPQAVAAVLAVKEQAGRDLTETLAESLQPRHILLVLDNAEHLLEACSQLIHRLLRRCDRLAILVTSRERLNIAGELTYRVPSLSVPDARSGSRSEEILACEAARLFIDRARLQQPDLVITTKDASALGSICRRLDGIALAIELAAARIRAMSMGELSTHLVDRFTVLSGGPLTVLPRHRTLRSLIDWSYELLSEPEKAMLRRASVFAGGWTLDAAERVCSDESIDRSHALDLLTSLTDKSLVVVDTRDQVTRFGMLETVRHYAQDRLRERSGEALVHARHVEYFVEAAERLAAQQSDADLQAKLLGLDKEHDNLRAALAWCEATARFSQRGLRLAGKLYWFWRARSHFDEGRRWVDRLLAVTSDVEPQAEHARALTTGAVLAYLQSDYSAAEAQWRQALAIRRRLGQRLHVAVLLGNLGSVAAIHDEGMADARALYEEALLISRELGDRRSVALWLQNLGLLSFAAGECSVAQCLLEESLSLGREFGGRDAVETLTELGKLKHFLGDNQSARTHLVEALTSAREFDNLHGISKALIPLALVCHDERDVSMARALLGEALGILQAVTDRQSIATALEAVAGLSLESSDYEDAARIWGCVQNLRGEFDCPRTTIEIKRYEHLVAAARSGLHDDAAFDCAWVEGRSLTLGEVVRVAMDVCDLPEVGR